MTPASAHVVPLRVGDRGWFLISLQTFGGPAGQIAVMQRTLVDERRWIGEKRFLHALNYCMLLPGPGGPAAGDLHRLAAQRLARRPDRRRAVRPARRWSPCWRSPGLYVAHGDTTFVTGLFLGLAPAVLAIVVQAVLRIGRRALRNRALVVLAVAAFLALALFGVPFPLVVLGAGVVGWAARPLASGRCSRSPTGRRRRTTRRR